MRYTYQVWAPPAFWGPEIRIEKASAIGSATFSISFTSISQAPSSFELEVTYWKGSLQKHDIVIGPGEYTFTMDCGCVTKVRAKSHSLGQLVEVSIDGL